MATRARKSWKLDSQGHYARQIGWKTAKGGRRVQHKFRLGADLNEAIQELHREVPVVRFVPDDVEAYSVGRQQWNDENRQPIHVPWVPPGALENARVLTGANFGPVMAEMRAANQRAAGTLHQAMHDFIAWIEEDYYRPHLNGLTDYGRNKIRQVKTLMSRHEDMSLAELDYEHVERMLRYWRQRPLKKDSEERISVKSASNYVGELKRFFLWLHRSPRYPWRKPEDFDDIDLTVDRDDRRKTRKLVQENVFTLDELILLNRYATPLERVFLLLGLNCGFGMVEIATLSIGDIYLNTAHSPRHREILDFESTSDHSFIKLVRRKSGVYGEFLLFPQTVEAIQWVLKTRYKQPNPTPSAPLLLNSRGEPYDKPTKSGNRNQQIPNRFADLLRRIREDGNEVRKLSFGKLRKTAGDLIRRKSDGEVASVFLMHGQAVKTDDLADVYTSRPFGKVFRAILEVQEHLGPMFDAAGSEPFIAGPQAYTTRKTVDRIMKLHHDGMSIREIAEKVGKSTTTVHRHIQRSLERETLSSD